MAKYTTTLNEYLTSELQAMGLNEFVNDGKLTYTDESFQFIQKILYFDEDVEEIVNHRIFKGFKFKEPEVDRVFKESFILRFIDREINRQTIESFASQVLYVTLTHQEYIYNIFSSELTKFLQNHVIDKTEDIGNAISKEIQKQKTIENSNGKDHNNTTVDTTGSENSTSDGTAKHREAEATLPQSQQNLSLNSDTMAYADSQSGANDKTTDKTDSTSKSNSKSVSDGTNENERNATTDQDSEQNQDTIQNHDGLTVTYDLDNLEQLFDMKEKVFDVFDKKCFLQIW